MRKMLSAALAGATILATAGMVPQASAQSYDSQGGYEPYRPAPTGYYDSYGEYHAYAPPTTAYTPAPDYAYNQGYADAPAVAGSTLGAAIAGYTHDGTPYDALGPDPNGMIAPDGHRIKCKNETSWNDWRHAYVTRRVCY